MGFGGCTYWGLRAGVYVFGPTHSDPHATLPIPFESTCYSTLPVRIHTLPYPSRSNPRATPPIPFGSTRYPTHPDLAIAHSDTLPLLQHSLN